MSAASFWERLIWTRFSKPRSFGALYKHMLRKKPVRIVELGIGDGTRALRMIRLAETYTQKKIHYCGIDLFEARETRPLPLKTVHHQLAESGAQVRLVPGDLLMSLGRTANLLPDTDLLVIDSVHRHDELEQVTQFFPRMLRSDASIARFEGSSQSPRLRWLAAEDLLEIRRQAA